MGGRFNSQTKEARKLTNRFNLNGKTALITGAAGLLGLEHSAALLEVQASLVITDIEHKCLNESKKKLKKEFPEAKIETLVMDVTSEASILEAKNMLKEKNVTLDILINNAALNPKYQQLGDCGRSGRLENFSTSQWDNEIAVGLKGAFLCIKIFGKQMAEKDGGGVILNVASDLSVIAPDQRIYNVDGKSRDEQNVKPLTYSVIKSGLVGLSKYVSTYWADRGVRCNSISPGGVFDGQDETFVHKLESLIPLGRMADRKDYRAAVQFLCSDGSAYMTGQNLVIDGGRSVW